MSQAQHLINREPFARKAFSLSSNAASGEANDQLVFYDTSPLRLLLYVSAPDLRLVERTKRESNMPEKLSKKIVFLQLPSVSERLWSRYFCTQSAGYLKEYLAHDFRNSILSTFFASLQGQNSFNFDCSRDLTSLSPNLTLQRYSRRLADAVERAQ